MFLERKSLELDFLFSPLRIEMPWFEYKLKLFLAFVESEYKNNSFLWLYVI